MWSRYVVIQIFEIAITGHSGASLTIRDKLNQQNIRAWISNHIHSKQWDVINHLCPNFSADYYMDFGPKRNNENERINTHEKPPVWYDFSR